MTTSRGISRRAFLRGAAAAPLVPAFLTSFHELAAAERKRVKIRDVQVMMMQGASRTYTLVKITSDAGLYGIAEAYGTPGVGVKEQVLSLKPWLVGKDPLEIDKLYTQMGERTRDLSGTRTDGSAHNLMRAVSGIEMALWDLAGKILDVPTSTLLGGKFRDKVRVYDHAAPRNMLDKASVADWAAKVKAHPSGFTCHKFGFPEQRSGDRQGARPVQSRADHQGADQRAEGIRELPRSHRLGSRSDGALPLGVRPAHVDSDRRRRRIGQAGLAGGSAAGRLLRFVEAAVRGVEGADLHGRESRAPRRVQGLHPESGLRHPSSRPAELRRLPRDQAHRRHGARLRAADGESQHRQPGLHLRRRRSGRRRSATTSRSKRSPAKAAGWIRCCCSTDRTSRTASSR